MTRRLPLRPLALALLAAGLAGAGGCSLFTVNARSGTDALPVDLRSSADVEPPKVGVANVPSTQPTGMLDDARRRFEAVAVAGPQRIYEWLTLDRFKEAARNLKNSDADIRRVAINRVSARRYGQVPPYTDVYRTTAQFDSDGLVRATAVRAINHARDEQSDATLVAALADGHPQVRLEAAKALGNLPAPDAEPALRKLATAGDEDIDTRLAALDALRHYKTLDTQRTLVSQLNSNNFSLAWQARRSLFLQTGADYRYDEPAWLNHLSGATR